MPRHAQSFHRLAGLGRLAGLLGLLGLPADAQAQTSEWAGQKYGRARLVAGVPAEGAGVAGRFHAGIEFALEPGWKTYWRHPGEAGVPPQLDWAGSTNLANARVLYPAPGRMQDAGFWSLGYKTSVVLPVEITPKDPGQPVGLALTLEYGVCKDICVPVEAKLALTVAAGRPLPAAPQIAAALLRVPRTGRPDGPRLDSLKLDVASTPPRLIGEARFPGGSAGADLVLERGGAGGTELLPLPVITARTGPDRVRFELRLGSAEEATRLAGQPLTATLISTRDQAEQAVRVE